MTTSKQAKLKMVHIRLDERTHRELKILAVRNDTTVQDLVEELIKSKVAGD
jgi:predicted HicB family RNase H-like nuclease